MEDNQTRDAIALTTTDGQEVRIKAQFCYKLSKDFPLSERSGHGMVVEVELHNFDPSHQVDFNLFHKSHGFAGGRGDSSGQEQREGRGLRGG